MRRNLSNTRKQRGSKSGPALIVATGPSLSKVNESTLMHFRNLGSLFGINQYANSSKGAMVPPNYLVLNDEPFWNATSAKIISAVNNLEALVQSKSVNFVIQPAHREILFKEASTIFYHGIPLTGFNLGKRIDKLNSLPNITIFHALATAEFLGYSPIYLVGYDLSFIKYLSSDINGYTLMPHHHGSNDENSIPLYSFRRSLADLFGSMAFQIQSLKQFDKTAVQVGYESFIDTLPKISENILRSRIGLPE
jgi:hypothetical protein